MNEAVENGGGGVAPLRVAWVTINFPLPSETFAAVDLRSLLASGCMMSVHAMRAPHRDAARLSSERGTAAVRVAYKRWGGLAGMRWAVRHPCGAVGLLGRILAWGWKDPRHLVVGLVAMPRAMAIMAEIEGIRPQVVHLFWGHYPSLVGYLVSRQLPGTVLTMFLGAYDLSRAYPGSSWLSRRVAQVFTHARANLPDLQAMGVPGDRVRVVYRGLDPELLARPPVGDRRRGRILLAARLVPGKGVDDAISALSLLRRSLPAAHLVVLGDGPERGRLHAHAHALGLADCVEFAGHIPQQRLFAEMSCAEAFVLLSHKDGERLPNAVKEAMAIATVPVVADSPGMSELITHGVDGMIVPPRDPGAAAAALLAVLSDPARRGEMAAAAQATVRGKFSAVAAMREYIHVWRQAMGG